MLTINAVKGFKFGSEFCSAKMQGGISKGMDIYFRVFFKPVATIMQNQQTIDADGNIAEIHGKGRHAHLFGAITNYYCRSHNCTCSSRFLLIRRHKKGYIFSVFRILF